MLYLAEFLIVGCLAYSIWRIFRQGLARNCLGIGICVVGVVAATAACFLTDLLVLLVSSNLVLRAVLPLIAMGLGYVLAVFFLKRRYRSDEAPLVVALKKRLVLPTWGERLTCTALSLLLLMTSGLILLFVVTLASANPLWGDTIASHTLYLRFLSPSRTAEYHVASEDGETPGPMEQVVAEQDRFFQRAKRSWDYTRDSIADWTGTTATLEQLEALRDIINLDPSEHAWLVERNSGLKKLINHPQVLKIVRDDRLMEMVERVGHGSAGALYALGDEPAIHAFLEDEEVLRIIHSIDLLELQRQVKQRRRERRKGVPLRWSLARINSTLALDGQLAKKTAGWERLEPTASLSWPADTRIGLARVGISTTDRARHQVQLRFRTSGHVTLFINDRSTKLTEHDGAMTTMLTIGGTQTTVVLMVRFGDPAEARTCFAEAVLDTPATR